MNTRKALLTLVLALAVVASPLAGSVSAASGNATFTDDTVDGTALTGETIEFDSLSSTGSSYKGTTISATNNNGANLSVSYDGRASDGTILITLESHTGGTPNIQLQNRDVTINVSESHRVDPAANGPVLIMDSDSLRYLFESSGTSGDDRFVDTGYEDSQFTNEVNDQVNYTNSIVSYYWTFGDGSNASGVAPLGGFTSAGEYTVQLTTTDSEGLTETTSKTYTISEPNTVTADYGLAPSTPVTGETVTFDASNSVADLYITSYQWSFGDGSNASGVAPSHAFTSAGEYTVQVTVTDENGNSDTLSKVITVGYQEFTDVSNFTNASISVVQALGGGNITTFAEVEANNETYFGTVVSSNAPANGSYEVGSTYDVTVVQDNENLTSVDLKNATIVSATERVGGDSVQSFDYVDASNLSTSVEQLKTTGGGGSIIGDGSVLSNYSNTTLLGGLAVLLISFLALRRD